MFEAGQYRKVQNLDDGHVQYQCLWCKQTLTTGDWIEDWLFCPKCGKSWFKQMKCRPHDWPRWAYDRNIQSCHIPGPKPTRQWAIQSRWDDETEWTTEYTVPLSLGSWRLVVQRLRTLRAAEYSHQYRARVIDV